MLSLLGSLYELLAGVVPEGGCYGVEGYLEVSAALGLDVLASLG